MENLETLLGNVPIIIGIGGIALSIITGFKKYVLDSDCYDATGLLDPHRKEDRYCSDKSGYCKHKCK